MWPHRAYDPGMAETPVRKVRIDNPTWDAFDQIARKNGETASGRIRRLITEDVKHSANQEHQ